MWNDEIKVRLLLSHHNHLLCFWYANERKYMFKYLASDFRFYQHFLPRVLNHFTSKLGSNDRYWNDESSSGKSPVKLHIFWGVGGVCVQMLGGSGVRACVVLVLLVYIWNASGVSLVLPTFDDTGSLGFSRRQMVRPPGFMVLTWVTASRFLAGNREAKTHHFLSTSGFLCFLIFLLLLNPQRYSSFECCLLELLLNNNDNIIILILY